MSFQVRTGIVTGRNHILDGKNCQDALHQLAFERDGKTYIVGAIADGCGEGTHSEVGAQLAVQFIPYTVRDLLQQGISFENLPTLLFEKLIDFLKNLIDSYNFSDIHEYIKFVHEHLLFTLIGFIIAPENTIVFAAGDGVVLINDDIYLREQDNTPTYIGYHLIEQRYLQAGPSLTAFDLYHVPSDILKRMAIGSDAWLSERALLDQIWVMK